MCAPLGCRIPRHQGDVDEPLASFSDAAVPSRVDTCQRGCGDRPAAPTGASCANIHGVWNERETATIVCTPGGTQTESQSDQLDIVQTGCRVHWTVLGVSRDGSVNGNRLTASGQLAIGEPGAVITENVITIQGEISSDLRTIEMTSNGRVSGRLGGQSQSCVVQSTAKATRAQ
jgi:hypothetical protein